MSEVTDLVVIEKQNAMAVFTTKEQLDPIIEAIEKEARSLVPDVSTRKGRDAIASMAHKVARSKTYIDNAGKDLVAELKALPKQIDESRRIVRERLDALKDEVRRPLTEWEAEQERIRVEEAWNAMHEEALVMNKMFDDQRAAQIEADHEMALLMNKDFDRDREEQRRQAEQAQRDHEERIKREAAEQARRDAEAKHKAELEAATRREAEEKARAELAERQRIEAEQRAAREKQEAEERARREKEEAVAAERRRLEEAEAARLAEEQRKAEEEARRAADKEHRRTVNRRVIADLIAQGIPEEFAQKALLAIAGGKVQDAHIKY
ncbi:IgA-specific serine endopeptidase autotransporter [Enterobacter cloacae]|nr:IgA-specific serine endopeptidase autotransporter [Enterobacter cloacae]CAE7493048.1 IgA-specific serine endopeptidase autotransporter [Enterobacter cloacae]CAE7519933.1 IgA-specific serine endopeptidase autotransporter [Enterobacter cloacae]CAH3753310.1 IgA-specific serine endopeptidase autotransporter [Enterobacter cloacae]CAH3758938.1 IgA-specific serine endopeptidase autotransporter [Enterobacter cloacae]